MRLTFCGAAGEVTGSNIFVEAAGKKILLDCGLFQGTKQAEEKNLQNFPYDPKSIDSVVICHAHLDHTGRLPKLVKEGFRGKIFSTAPTRELAQLVLEDNEKLAREEAERVGRIPFYDQADVERALQFFTTLGYGETIEIAEGVLLTFKNAGHILGSAIAILESEGKRIAYTSDLGNTPCLLLPPHDFVDNADIVICESTYGGRIHEDLEKRMQKLSEIINATIEQNSVLLIPSFAIERTQEILHDIEHFCSLGGCEKPVFYLDSPLAIKVTEVFDKYPDFLSEQIRNSHKNSDFFGLEWVKITSSVDQSKAINDAPCPKIIIAGSGMMNGGRILFHAIRYLPDPKNTLLFIGYQSEGTLGRRIFNGEKEVTIHHQRVEVEASIKSIGSYSAHADMPQLLEFVGKVNGCKQVFIVHGEKDQSEVLASGVRLTGKEVIIPKFNESFGV